MQQALAEGGTSVVASHSLAGGALCGKYDRGEKGRLTGQLDEPRRQSALALGARLSADGACDELDATPAQLALAFALRGPGVASVLFGATGPAQLEEDVGALGVAERLTADELAELRALAADA